MINAGKDLNTDVDASYDDDYLTWGTDFTALPINETFNLIDQDADGNWDIGAVVYADFPHDEDPEISAVSVTPAVVANEGTLTYSVTATDPEGQELSYKWFVNGTQFR